MQNLNYIKRVAEENGFLVKENEAMKNHTSFKIGGEAQLMVVATTEQGLRQVLKACKEKNVSVFFLGKGSNLLVSDNGIDGVVLKLGGVFTEIKLLDDNKIYCGAGASLASLCSFACEHGLSGLEFAWGIPGSAGGAAYMNAGAYGGQMKDVLTACHHLDQNAEPAAFNGEELDLSYRHSIYADKGFVITGLVVQLTKAKPEQIRCKMNDFMERRKDKQPLDFPSAGSVFKRPPGLFAGTLIDQAGLKGKQIGGAAVSEKHAGFIINKGDATCADVKALVAYIQEIIMEKEKVSLQCEIKPIGKE